MRSVETVNGLTLHLPLGEETMLSTPGRKRKVPQDRRVAAGKDKIDLSKPSVLPNGLRLVKYPVEAFDLRAELSRLLVERHFVSEPVPLEDLHRYVKPEDRVNDDRTLNNVSKSFYDTSTAFHDIYFSLIRYLEREVLGFDFVFQETPTIRFHFPGRFTDIRKTKEGLNLGHHSDTMSGHPFEEINAWLPLTFCYGTNALQLGSLEKGTEAIRRLLEDIDYNADTYFGSAFSLILDKLVAEPDYQRFVLESVTPVEMRYGDLLLFDPRCLHGAAENVEPHTRVSLDFRVIPLDAYNTITREHQSQGRTRRKFVRGDVYHAKTARELEGSPGGS